MFTDYLVVVSVTVTTALVWRTLLLDHPVLLEAVQKIPLLGGALSCGFCAAVWFSLIATLFLNPLAAWSAQLTPLLALGIGWFSVSAGVLFGRNLLAALMEGTGVLTHLHRYADQDKN